MKSLRDLSRGADPGRWEIPGYRIDGVIGSGGFGEILKATRLRDSRASAVKIAHARLERARTQFERERAALLSLGSTIAPELLSSGELTDGTPWLALEFLRSPSLASLLPRDGKLDSAELRAIILALADVLAELHARNWLHLDLKPGHIFIERTGARLVDFGLAIHERGDAPSTASFGTAAYMSPEQVRGDLVDARADVYAAGAILFELITGTTPFVGSPGELRQAHLALRPPRPSERAQVPARLEEVVLRCLSKSPDERYRDCRTLRAALRDAFDEPADAAAPATRAQSPVAALARRTLGLLVIHTEVDLLTLQRAVEACGGALACAGGRHAHVAFEPAARENAVRLALDGAQALMASGIATRALVDLASLRVIDGRSGTRYLLNASEKIELPTASELPRLLLTSRAAATIPSGATVPCPAADGLLELVPAGGADTARPLLVGRDRTVEELLKAAVDALDHRAPTLAAVTGEAGIGKTSVGAELAARLRSLDRPPEVLEVRAREGVLGQDETLRALISWALDIDRHDGAPGDGGRELLSALSPLKTSSAPWAPLALALGWIPADATALRPWQAAPGALRAAVVRGAGDALRARARARPLCVVLDDAHLADAAALDALEYATLAESAVPLFVCALARPPIHAARPGLGERAARQLSLTLEPLAEADGAQLCRRLLLPAENIPTRAIQRLVERSRGVPILLVELVRGLRARGLVRQRGSDGRWFVATDELDALPDLPLVDWLAQREMAGLPEALAAHARLVALLGDEVSRREVAGVVAELDRDGLAATSLDPDVATRRLLEIHVLVERESRMAFRHPLLREAVARSAGDTERRSVHRAAFRYYLLATFLPDRDRLPRLATHAEACGLHAEAASLWLQTAESLRARHAYLEAESQYTRALSQLAEDDARGRFSVFRGRGGVRYRLGRYEDAIADLTTAEAHARALGHTAGELDCLLEEATALDWMNDYSRSAERLAQAERLAAHRRTAPLDQARLVLARGRAHFRAGRTEDAVAAFEAAAALADVLGDPGYETLVVALLVLSAVLPNLGRTTEAERTIARAIELAGEHGDALHLASAFNNRRNIWIARGRLDRALADQLSFLQIGRDLGMIGIEYVAQYNLGELLYQAEELDRAEAHVLRAVEVETKYPEIAGRPVARLLHARLLAYRGDMASARTRCAEIQSIDARASGMSGAASLLSESDQILLEMVSLAASDGSPEHWTRLCARSRETSLEQEPIEVHEACGIAALRSGRRSDAAAALREALRLADEIPNVMRSRVESRLTAVSAAAST